jgi:hypothetical protein
MLAVTDAAMSANHSNFDIQPVNTSVNNADKETTASPTMMCSHMISFVSTTTDLAQINSKYDDNNHLLSTLSLKDKSLLVPARLAIKRQRKSIRNDRKYVQQPIVQDLFQIELGEIDQNLVHPYADYSKKHTNELIGSNTTREKHRRYLSAYPSSAVRVNTSYSTPRDISLLYR